jgi:inosine/xanthosine triphosphatase
MNPSLHVAAASTNPVKIEAARRGLAAIFPDAVVRASGISVPSGVSDQPMTDAETELGAGNRARAASLAVPEADYWVGLEGGCEDTPGGMRVFAWAVVLKRDSAVIGRARTGMFHLPDEVAALVRAGMELGHADDQVFGRHNSKHSDGSVGLLTGGAIDRTAYYAHAVTLALVPFRFPHLTWE